MTAATKPAPGRDPSVFVVLDSTSLWDAFVGSGSLAFRTLSALGAKSTIRLCVPEVVVRECKSQAGERVGELVQTIEKSITSLRKLSPTAIAAELENAATIIRANAKQLQGQLCARIDAWIRDASVKVLTIENEHGCKVVEAYFAGSAPFKHPKSRADFPDAFVWQALITLAADERKDIHFISNDQGFKQHCVQAGITLHKTILAILESGALPITAQPVEYELARQLRENSASIVAAARRAVHDTLPHFEFPMPHGVARDTNAGPFVIERVLALKQLVVDPEAVALLGNRTFAIPFKASLTLRASFKSAIDQQGAVFNILDMERVLRDLDVEVAGTALAQAAVQMDDWPAVARVEVEDVRIISSKPAQTPSKSPVTGDVIIEADMKQLGKALRHCTGLVLIVGRRKARRIRAASVLLNDVTTAHPDRLFLATHGALATATTGNVRPMNRGQLEDDDAFVEKVDALQPDGLSIEISDATDLALAQYFTVRSEMFVVGVTPARDPEELEEMLGKVWIDIVVVMAK